AHHTHLLLVTPLPRASATPTLPLPAPLPLCHDGRLRPRPLGSLGRLEPAEQAIEIDRTLPADAIGLPPKPLRQPALGPDHVRQRSEEHTSELQSRENLVCRLLLEKKKKNQGR